jgi:hypothetical protein
LQRANDAGDDLGGGAQRGVALPPMLPFVFSGTSNSARPLYIPAAMMEKDAEKACGAVTQSLTMYLLGTIMSRNVHELEQIRGI